jgi:rubrerythrin
MTEGGLMDIIDILHTAIGIEQEGIDFYTVSAKKVKDANGKATLLFLANEEKRHKAFFESVLHNKGKADAKSKKFLLAPRMFPDSKEYAGKDTPASSESRIILEHARDTEKHSIEFYSGALNLADTAFRDGLSVVIREEEQHLAWIEFLLESLDSHEEWASLHGHFSLDGG